MNYGKLGYIPLLGSVVLGLASCYDFLKQPVEQVRVVSVVHGTRNFKDTRIDKGLGSAISSLDFAVAGMWFDSLSPDPSGYRVARVPFNNGIGDVVPGINSALEGIVSEGADAVHGKGKAAAFYAEFEDFAMDLEGVRAYVTQVIYGNFTGYDRQKSEIDKMLGGRTQPQFFVTTAPVDLSGGAYDFTIPLKRSLGNASSSLKEIRNKIAAKFPLAVSYSRVEFRQQDNRRNGIYKALGSIAFFSVFAALSRKTSRGIEL
ncbi:hypothetical protein HYU11_05165 [Candidatus Woesearchaeota archaeon]|nr:hypothetical protein [Candidatus Woesearchaeota archaeon]